VIHDVIVVGSGAAGTSAASLLAREGLKTLLIDKSATPRDTVRSDGLMPQAVYWLERIGCADEVLAASRGCIKASELYVDGKRLLSGRFPADTIYPDFAILIVRRRFDEIMLRNAMAQGAAFEGHVIVRGIEQEKECVRVFGERNRKPVEFRARIVIGADGTSSAVSRAIGNNLKDGVLGLSVRTTYNNVNADGAGIRVYFNREYFPSYGWMFVDDHGAACVGIGCASDKNFPIAENLSEGLRRFIDADLSETLADATRVGPFCGAISGYYRPSAITANRVLLIGDAANLADPLNRGGIHTAMESAVCATEACCHAFKAGDFSRTALKRYETLWSAEFEPDWRMAEMFMSIVKNPNLKDLAMFALRQVGSLSASDQRFRDFVSSVFSGAVSQSAWLTPNAIYNAFPKDLATWQALLRSNAGASTGPAAGSLRLAAGAAASIASTGWGFLRTPLTSMNWGMDVAAKAIRLADRQIRQPQRIESLSPAGHGS
jgi:geranylgeranyl reductase family protein